jgi:hypothetical protein
VDTRRQDEQRMGYNVPEVGQRAKRKTVSRGGADIFRSWANMPDRIGRTDDKTKGRKREDSRRYEM